jgi:hypothetical protein
METNLKTKWGILAGVSAIALAIAVGCETKGGSSGDDDTTSTNKPVVIQVCFGVPTCSDAGPGALDGAVFNGAGGFLYVSPSCASTNATMYVWIKVISSLPASAIDHYIWTLRNWSTNSPNGIFTADSYDSIVDTNGVLKVRTTANQIRYSSALAGDLLALTNLFNQAIDVTVMARDGQTANAYISFYLHNGTATGDDVIYGNLSALDSPSNVLPGRRADYFSLTAAGATNILNLTGDFDTFLALYDTNGTLLAANDDISGLNMNSQIDAVLTNGPSYLVEATAALSITNGNYSISVTNLDSASNSVLTLVNSPFETATGSCSSVAGTYSLTETLAINLTFNGQAFAFTNITTASATVAQTNCTFGYLLNDPTGLIPPVVRVGRVNFNNLTLINDAYLPQTPEIVILSSRINGTGITFATGMTINSSGTITGTFLGLPFSLDYSSVGNFAR